CHSPTLRPNWSTLRRWRRGPTATACGSPEYSCGCRSSPAPPTRGWNEEVTLPDHTQRAFALVGPGRAGTTLALAMQARGWTLRAIAGRAPDAPSVLAASAELGAPACDLARVGADADVVLIATPDAAIADAAAATAPGLREGVLVLHLSGACTL